MKYHPRPYQESALQHVLDNPYAALYADMGLGKTVVVATALAELLDTLQAQRVLVLAPKRVAMSVWVQEVDKWDHLHGRLPIRSFAGLPAKHRAEILEDDTAVHVLNYDVLPWLVRSLDGAWPYDVVVLDESSKVKNRGSLRWRALKHVRPAIKRMIQMTGTPAANGLTDLWAPTYLLDQGKRLGRTLKSYHERWFTPADREGRKWEPIDGAVDKITEALRDICFTLRAEDYLDLPPLVTNQVEVRLPAHLQAEYRRLEREMMLQLASEERVTAVNAAARSGKCHQYAQGAIYLDEEGEPSKKWERIHDEKLDALQEVIDSAGGEPVLVAYHFQHDLVRLQKAFPQARALDSDPATIDAWNRGEIEILLAHPASAGHGLNLQGGGRHLAFFSLNWSLETYQQIIERIGPTRQLQAGTPRPVYVHHLVTTGTVDELILERLVTKASVQDVFKRRLRAQL